MKKKVLAIMLTLASVMSMTACGKKDSKETSKKKSSSEKTSAVNEEDSDKDQDSDDEKKDTAQKNDDAENVTEKESSNDNASSEKDPAHDPIWEYKEVTDYSSLIPGVEASKVTAQDGTELTVYATTLGAKKEENLKNIRNDEFVKSLGVIADYYKESGTANEERGNQWTFDNAEGIVTANISEDKSKGLTSLNGFKLVYCHDTSTFTNDNKVQLEFFRVDLYDENVQAEIQRLVKAVYGDELSDTLLFAKDPNAKFDHANNLSVDVEIDGLNYHFLRNVSSAGSGMNKIMFEVSIKNPEKYPHPYDAGFQSRLSEFKALPNAVFGGDIGNQDFIDVRNFADVYHGNKDYGDNILPGMETNEYSAEKWISEDGREYYIMNFKKYEPSDLSLSYEFGLKDGVNDCHGEFNLMGSSTRQYGDLMEVREGLLASGNHMVQAMFGFDPALKVSECDSEGSDGSISFRIPHTFNLFGKEWTMNIDVSVKESNVGGKICVWRVSWK